MCLSAGRTLTQLCARAKALVRDGAGHAARSTQPATVRFVSGVTSSLVSLSCGVRDMQLHERAREWVEALSLELQRFPNGAPLPDEAVINVLRVVRSSGNSGGSWGIGSISSLCLSTMLMELDERIMGPQLAPWKPRAVLFSLHAIATANCAVQLSMVNSLLYCAKEHLQQLDEQRTARLLWCIAKLQQVETHSVLWKSTCRRLLRMFPKLKYSGRALVLEGLLLFPDSTCEAHYQLLSLLHNEHHSRMASEFGDDDEDRPTTPVCGNHGAYQTLKTRLLSQVHQLPVSSLTAMLLVSGGTNIHCSLSASQRGSVDSETTYYLLRHLAGRSLNGAECREVLEAVAFVEPSELTELLVLHIISCIRSVVSPTGPTGIDRIRMLETVCVAVAVEQQRTRGSNGAVLALLRLLIVECHKLRDSVLQRYDGRLVGILSVALDVLAAGGGDGVQRGSAPDECFKFITGFPDSWAKGSTVGDAALVECVSAVCSACKLLRVPPVLRLLSHPAVSRGRGGSTVSGQNHTEPMLERCGKIFKNVDVPIPISSVFDIWQHIAGVSAVTAAGAFEYKIGNGGEHDVLQQVAAVLFLYTEKKPSSFPLREVARFVGAAPSSLPVQAYELLIRCLKKEHVNVNAHYLEILLLALEETDARGDKAALERLMLSLFIRSLGHETSLAEGAPFTAQQLVRLFHCSSRLSMNATASMRATVLQRIIFACGESNGIEELNTAASLLPQLPPGPHKNALAAALIERGKAINPSAMPDVQKGLLLVYLYKAGQLEDKSLVEAFRRKA
uniref:Uncharacterized protein n=1 Tax=Trypanosoma congolense (strain IL3000) TaxID=1068625 RepID=G0UIS3_TRYCI|nr:conserved hypothetical protein [Trypanosoma congolense IL3000]